MKLLLILAAIVLIVQAEHESSLRELTNGNLIFTAKTYKELLKQNTGNFLTSPLSVEVVLALAECGAGGETAKQLVLGLNLPDTQKKIYEAFQVLVPSLNVDDGYTLTSANKIYTRNDFVLNPDFQNVATKIFDSEVQAIDFSSVTAASEINKWVEARTHKKIKDLVRSSDLDKETALVLINALYFSGSWIKPFYDSDTREGVFRTTTKTETKVKMMDQTDRFNYYRDDTLKAQFLEMNYYTSPVSITFVLPDEIDGLTVLEENIDKILVVPEYGFEKVHVKMPHIDIEHKIDLIPILQQFGIQDAFERHANFSGIGGNLKLSKVFQKSFIAIDEKGTVAAAASAAIAVPTSAFIELHPKPPKEFIADHPFIFYLKTPQGILFIGRYVEPSN